MVQALRGSFRDLLHAPGFAALAILTLALGIGAATAMFSVVDAVLLRPLPYPHVERFAQLWTSRQGSTSPGVTGVAVPRLREELFDIAEVEGYQMGSATITGGAEPVIVGAPYISPRLLTLVGATPALGRLFTDDDVASTTPPIIISHSFWTSSFGEAPDIIGREVQLDDARHRVVGVMSPRVRFPEANAAVWRPLAMTPAKPSRARIMAIAVRRAGVDEDQFSARLNDVSAALVQAALLPEGQSIYGDVLVQERFGRSSARAYWLMFGAVMLVVLVACVNVSNLLLARTSANHGQFALRSALGAGRRHLIWSAAAQCLAIAALAAVAGAFLAKLLLQVLLALVPPQLTMLAANAAVLDARVLAFAAVLAFMTCLCAGLLPVIRVARIDPLDALKRHSQNVSRRDDIFQGALITTQLALVLILLAGGGLLLRSFVHLANVDTGIDARNLVVVQAALTSRDYMSAGATSQFLLQLEERLESTGMMRVTYSGGTPVVGPSVYMNVQPEAEGGAEVDFSGQILPYIEVAPDYFDTLGIPIISGRTFAANDPEDVLIVNDRLARAYWKGVSPIGKRFRPARDESWKTVIGVVGDVRQMRLSDPTSHGMEIYRREPAKSAGGFYSILARTTVSAPAAVAAIKQMVWQADDRIPLQDAMLLSDRLAESMNYERFFLRLSLAFTAVATALAAIGVYSAFAFWVARRRRELAIRVAVGASPETVIGSVLARALRLAAAGAAIGLAIALSGAHVIKTMLFETDPRDPATLVAVTMLLTGVAVAACAVPAINAARVDPVTTLRAE